MSARDHFAELVRMPEVPLAEACATIAAHLGHLDAPDEVGDGLRRVAERVAARAGADGTPVDLATVAQVLFAPPGDGGLGFRGNRRHYDDVRNSLLHDVLRRRTGIPITLSIVTIEVAGHLGVPAVGVGMPGHFLVGEPDPRGGRMPVRWLDPFHGGRWLDRAGAEARFRAVVGAGPRFEDDFLAPTPRGEIVARVLNNLVVQQRRIGDPNALVAVVELRSQIPVIGRAPRSMVEQAEAYAVVGRVGEAVALLEELRPRIDPRRREELDRRLLQLRAAMN